VPGASTTALANLLANAVKFSPPGGALTIDAGEEEGCGVLLIRDEGPGIRPEEIPLFFERLHRGRAARAIDAPGLGLGLAITGRSSRDREGTSRRSRRRGPAPPFGCSCRPSSRSSRSPSTR
jgi:K+-sensing histidine kinase KdpD